MTVNIHMLTLGIVRTNCYIVGDTETREAIVIDPSADAAAILGLVNSEGWQVREILATHTHFDHILAARDLKEKTGAMFRIHKLDLDQLRALPQVLQRWVGETCPPAPEPDAFVEEGDSITLGAIRLDVLFTPGHSAGHVSYVCHDNAVVFSGDCIFKGTVGRTDLPGTSHDVLMQSIMQKLMPLHDDYTIACGHGHTTTIAQERQTNPFVLDWNAQH